METSSEIFLMSMGYAILSVMIVFLVIFYDFSYKKLYYSELHKKTEQVLYIKTTN